MPAAARRAPPVEPETPPPPSPSARRRRGQTPRSPRGSRASPCSHCLAAPQALVERGHGAGEPRIVIAKPNGEHAGVDRQQALHAQKPAPPSPLMPAAASIQYCDLSAGRSWASASPKLRPRSRRCGAARAYRAASTSKRVMSTSNSRSRAASALGVGEFFEHGLVHGAREGRQDLRSCSGIRAPAPPAGRPLRPRFRPGSARASRASPQAAARRRRSCREGFRCRAWPHSYVITYVRYMRRRGRFNLAWLRLRSPRSHVLLPARALRLAGRRLGEGVAVSGARISLDGRGRARSSAAPAGSSCTPSARKCSTVFVT